MRRSTPTAAVSPLFGPAKASADMASVATTTYLAEPQLTYNRKVGPGELQALAGGTFQQTTSEQRYVNATGYVSDAVLQNLPAASTKTYYADNSFTYRCQSLFGRLNYNLGGKYISDNQLVGFAVPSQTGFSGITANFPAVVLNRGFELSLNTTNVQTGKFTWTSAATLTVPRNELLDCPGLAASAYNNQFLLGESTTLARGYNYTGIDPATGLASGAYVSPTGLYTFNPALSNQVPTNGYPRYYGGLQNSLSHKGLTLDFFLQFTKQTAKCYVPGSPPGQGLNDWTTKALRRWQKPGNVTDIPKATSSFGTAYSTYFNYTNSPDVYGDASFIRLKTLSLSYALAPATVQRLQGLRLCVQGQNLFTLTRYNGFDPEVPLWALPPQRVLTGGVQVFICLSARNLSCYANATATSFFAPAARAGFVGPGLVQFSGRGPAAHPGGRYHRVLGRWFGHGGRTGHLHRPHVAGYRRARHCQRRGPLDPAEGGRR